MKVESRIFEIITAFFFLVAIVYAVGVQSCPQFSAPSASPAV